MYSICQLINTILLRIEGIFTAFLVALSSVERAKTAVSVVFHVTKSVVVVKLNTLLLDKTTKKLVGMTLSP